MSKENLEEQQFEEFDVLSDLYLPLRAEEEKYADPTIAFMRENGVDPYELIGEAKVDGIAPIKRIQDKAEQETETQGFAQALGDFIVDIPEAAAISTLEALANLSNNVVQIGGAVSNIFFNESKLSDISNVTTNAAQVYNQSTETFVKNLETYRENRDVNGITKFLTDIGIDLGITPPINKMLKKVGMPSYVSTPLAFGLGYAFTGGDKEADNNMILDSQVINRTNEILAILPDTPESEVAELVATTFEGTLWAGAIQPLIRVFKTLKNVPAYMNQQTATAVAGGAGAGAVSDNIQNNIISDQTEK